MGPCEIFYYSGTGNSLHVARELQSGIQNSVLKPVLGYSREEAIKTEGDVVGFVFPIYFMTIPAPVREFIEKLDMDSATYIFMAATRIGTYTTAVPLMRKLLRKKGKRLDSHFMINMLSNSPTGLKPGKGDKNWAKKTREAEIKRVDKEILPEIERISEVVKNRSRYPERSHPDPLRSAVNLIMDPVTRRIGSEVGYYVDESCNGCGTCENVCLSGKIEVRGGKPLWRDDIDCYYCFACFNFCPQQAILVSRKYDRKDGRFRRPDVSSGDIAGQKRPIR